MKNMLFPLFVLVLFAACKRDVEDLPLERPWSPEFYARGEWRDTVPNVYTPFDYTVGSPVEPPFVNIFTCKSRTGIADAQKTIRSEIFGISNSGPHFYIRFSAPGVVLPDADSSWSKTELESFFTPGKVLPITGAPGEVEVGFELPFFVRTYLLANSGIAPAPDGEVTIVSTEDYEWTEIDFSGTPVVRRGKKIGLQFNAKLGRLIYKDGVPVLAGEAEIRNGQAAIYLEY